MKELELIQLFRFAPGFCITAIVTISGIVSLVAAFALS